jgi:hypothetical protein
MKTRVDLCFQTGSKSPMVQHFIRLYTIIIHKFHVILVEVIFVSLIYLVINQICDIIILFGRISNVHMSQRLCGKNIFSS